MVEGISASKAGEPLGQGGFRMTALAEPGRGANFAIFASRVICMRPLRVCAVWRSATVGRDISL